MCLIDDAESSDFSFSEARKARKVHICSECKRKILPKEKYMYFSFKVDNKISTNKTCQHCQVATRWLQKHCGGAVFYGVIEDLENHYQEGYRVDGLQRILVGIRRKWKSFNSEELLPLESLPTL
jgi:uncharacterized protein YfaT (DUF1175 family)